MADIEVNYEEVGALLKGPEVATMLAGIASDIASRCGCESDTHTMPTRTIASVFSEEEEKGMDILRCL